MSLVADPTNVVGRRVGASLIDGLLAFGPAGLVFASSLTEADAAARDRLNMVEDPELFCELYMEQEDGFCFSTDDSVYYTETGVLTAALTLYGIAIFLHVVLQGLTGWTVGKLLTGIRVVQADGRRAAFWRVLVRWLMWIVDSLPVFGLVGFITGLTTKGHRRVGDMVGGTFVVRKDAVGRPLLIPGVTAAPGTVPGAPGAPAGSGPQWDDARGTYIQWDPEVSSWMQWDEEARRWDPIPGQLAAPPPPPPPPSPPPPPPPGGGWGGNPPPPPPPP